MTRFAFATTYASLSARTRKLAAAGLTALAIGGGMVASATPASAGWRHHYGYYHGGWGAPVAAGIVGGLALGAIAASTYRPTYVASDCYVVRERVLTSYGWRRIRRTVCD